MVLEHKAYFSLLDRCPRYVPAVEFDEVYDRFIAEVTKLKKRRML